jgi:hypothetical protein
MTGRANLGDHFPAIRDQHALASTRAAKILAQPVLQLADAHSFH